MVRTSFDGARWTEAAFNAHGLLAERRLVGRVGVHVEARQRATRRPTGGATGSIFTMTLAHHRCTDTQTHIHAHPAVCSNTVKYHINWRYTAKN